MTYEEFITELWNVVSILPPKWRDGQKVFNACEQLYGQITRDVQFQDGIDCFYDDNKIGDFINAVWKRLKDDNN